MTFSPFDDLELSQRRPIAGLSCHLVKLPGSPKTPLWPQGLREHPEEDNSAMLWGILAAWYRQCVSETIAAQRTRLGAGTRGPQQRRGKDVCTQEGFILYVAVRAGPFFI